MIPQPRLYPYYPNRFSAGMFSMNIPSQQDIPPHSRLFVSCSRNTTREALEDAFGAYGTVEQIKLVTDRSTGQFKGTAFVKFAKASSAALALEALDEQSIDGEAPLKVMFAEPKGSRPMDSTDPSELPPRSRLFVTCPKEMTKEQLEELFSRFGEVENIKVLVDKATNASKGIAYVKFLKASSAAVAVEEVTLEAADAIGSRPVRCRVAEPRGTTPAGLTGMPYMGFPQFPMYPLMDASYLPIHDLGHFPDYPTIPMSLGNQQRAIGPVAGPLNTTAEQRRHDNNTPPGSRLFISFSKPLPVEVLQTIFMRYGPLETVYLVKGKNYGYAKYATAHAAQVAMHNLNHKLVEGVACRISIADPQKPSPQKPE